MTSTMWAISALMLGISCYAFSHLVRSRNMQYWLGSSWSSKHSHSGRREQHE